MDDPAPHRAATALRPLSPVSHGDRVLQALSAYIADAGLKPGDRLPAERALAEQLGVSRSTVREALHGWQAMGLVSMRVGSGTYLEHEIAASALHVPLTIDLERRPVLHALELRRSIETDAARLAAIRAGKRELAHLRTTLEEMEAAYARHGFAIRQDRAFHAALYAASGNPLYPQIFDQIINRISDTFNASRDNPFTTEPYSDASQPDHRALYEAVAAGEADAAAAAVTRILDFVEGTLRHDA